MSAGLLQALIEAGTPAALVARVATELAAANAKADILENRRRNERERKAKSREVTGQDVTGRDSADTPSLDKESFPQTPFKEIKPNPGYTHPRGRRLPDDWRPEAFAANTKAGLAIAKRGHDWAKGVLETFSNHWRGKAGRDACKVDWQATWGNWVIEADRRENRNGSYRNGSSTPRAGSNGMLNVILDLEANSRRAADDG